MVIAVGDRWTLDGTQSPAPPPLFADPLAGLITGSSSADVVTDPYEDIVVPVAKPVEADRESVQAMLKVLDDEGEPAAGDYYGEREKEGDYYGEGETEGDYYGSGPAQQRAPRTRASLPGMLPMPERKPAGQRVRQALKAYPYPRRNAAGKLPPTGERPAANRNMAGVVIALVLLVIFAVIAIQVISGIVDAIGGAFD